MARESCKNGKRKRAAVKTAGHNATPQSRPSGGIEAQVLFPDRQKVREKLGSNTGQAMPRQFGRHD
jgi:hypothetical protein